MDWLTTLINENAKFRKSINNQHLPTLRQPCPYAMITCMDPRVNFQAMGVMPFNQSGEIQSQVRVIRTLGGFAEDRSLLAGIHLAGFKEIAIVMHTDCGCCLAWSNVDLIIKHMLSTLSADQLGQFEQSTGKLCEENLKNWLCAFQDPYQTVEQHVMAIKQKDFVPDDLIVHGLVYDLNNGKIETVINGYTH